MEWLNKLILLPFNILPEKLAYILLSIMSDMF